MRDVTAIANKTNVTVTLGWHDSSYDVEVVMIVTENNCFVSTHTVGRALDCESTDCLFEIHHRWSHCVVSLSKTPYPLLRSGSTHRKCPDMTE